MKPSTYQQNVLDFVQSSDKNLIVSAVAGSGKTTLLKMIAENTIEMKKLYLAFNNEIVRSVSDKLEPSNCDVKTFHSYGKQSINNIARNCKVNKWKYYDIIESFHYNNDYDLEKSQIVRLIDIIRNWFPGEGGLTYINSDTVLMAMDHHEYDMSDYWYKEYLLPLTEFVRLIIDKGLNDTSSIDFGDMLFMPVVNCYPFRRYPLILVDEGQDLNALMRSIIVGASGQGSRIIVVGDKKQAIMGFAGADTKSFDKVKGSINAEELPLSICYRCPEKVIEFAKEYVPEIEGTGKEGVLDLKLSVRKFFEIVTTGDLVICRYNAPLLSTAFRLLSDNRKVKIKGKDFAGMLQQIVKTVEKKSNQVYESFETELADYIRLKITNSKYQDRTSYYLDAENCLLILSQSSRSFQELLNNISYLFDDQKWENVINLSSIHRSKGLEADKVFILLDRGHLKAPNHGQESNISYVGITRAKKELYLVHLDNYQESV